MSRARNAHFKAGEYVLGPEDWCTKLKKNGGRCKMPRMKGLDHCWQHSSGNKEKKQEVMGAATAGYLQQKPLKTMDDCLMWIADVAAAVRNKDLDTRIADCLKGLLHEFTLALKAKSDIEPEGIAKRVFVATVAAQRAKEMSIDDCKRILTQGALELFVEGEPVKLLPNPDATEDAVVVGVREQIMGELSKLTTPGVTVSTKRAWKKGVVTDGTTGRSGSGDESEGNEVDESTGSSEPDQVRLATGTGDRGRGGVGGVIDPTPTPWEFAGSVGSGAGLAGDSEPGDRAGESDASDSQVWSGEFEDIF